MCWSQIPLDALLRVYHHLEDPDRVRASSTCKYWRRVFFDPSLWRVRTFDLCYWWSRCFELEIPYSHSQILQNLTSFVDLFGRHVQHLKIPLPDLEFEGLNEIHQAEFVDTLLTAFNRLENEKPQLKTLQVSNLYIQCRKFHAPDVTDSIVNNLLDFLKDQDNLKVLSLKRATIYKPEDFDMLQCIGRSGSSNTLEVLDAVHLSHRVKEIRSEFSLLFNACKHLKEIRISYSCLGRGFSLKTWDSLKNSLKLLAVYLELLTDRNLQDEDILGSDWWQQTCQQIPELKVHFHHKDTGKDVSDFLVPEMPLQKIVWKEVHSSAGAELGKMATLVLYRLAHYFQQSLEIAKFRVKENDRSCVSKPAVLSVLSLCKNLKKLEFSPYLMSERMMEELRVEAELKHNVDRRVLSFV